MQGEVQLGGNSQPAWQDSHWTRQGNSAQQKPGIVNSCILKEVPGKKQGKTIPKVQIYCFHAIHTDFTFKTVLEAKRFPSFTGTTCTGPGAGSAGHQPQHLPSRTGKGVSFSSCSASQLRVLCPPGNPLPVSPSFLAPTQKGGQCRESDSQQPTRRGKRAVGSCAQGAARQETKQPEAGGLRCWMRSADSTSAPITHSGTFSRIRNGI